MMQLSEIGKLANEFWLEIPNYFPFVELDEFVVMPNHVHGIIVINKTNDGNICNGQNDKPVDTPIVETRHALSLRQHKTMGQKRFQNQGKGSLSSIIGSYKSVLTKNARKIHADFAWQPRFHDHIIRNDESFQRIKDYISSNLQNWKGDKFHK